MSFQNWMGKGAGGVSDGEMAYNNSSRMEPKRPQQWFTDGAEAELFPNKKQAVEVSNNNSFPGILNSNFAPWSNSAGFKSVSGHFTERLFDSETARTINYDGRNITSLNTQNMNLGRKDVEDPLGHDSVFGLSMSHKFEDPRLSLDYSGTRKAKHNQVKDSENVLPSSMGHAYPMGDNNTLSVSHSYSKPNSNTMSIGLLYNKGEGSILPVNNTYGRVDNNFISMGQPFSKEDNMSMGMIYKGRESTMPRGNIFSNGNGSLMSVGQPYSREDGNSLSVGHSYNKGNDTSIAMHQISDKKDGTSTSVSHIEGYKGEHNNLSMGNLYNKEDDNIISFGGYDDDSNPTGRLVCSYDLLMGQSSVQRSEGINEKDLAESNASVVVPVNPAQIKSSGGGETLLKKKEETKVAKKDPQNSFPSNVRSLLSTGMLDGVPVKYTAWSREKELRGVIKGSGYLCGCQSCNFAKVVNAYEFERHAGCKTKHPNNHIYFENGKTIYGIVQELKSTPQNILFDVIQTITGSPINQKSFRLWKESFLAATRELQRIYGKDDGKRP